MAQRMFTETTCDRCGQVERREQAKFFMPAAWRILKIGYVAADEVFVADASRLLCPPCVTAMHQALKADAYLDKVT